MRISRRLNAQSAALRTTSMDMITPHRQRYNLPIRVIRCLVRGKPKGEIDWCYRQLSIVQKDIL